MIGESMSEADQERQNEELQTTDEADQEDEEYDWQKIDDDHLLGLIDKFKLEPQSDNLKTAILCAREEFEYDLGRAPAWHDKRARKLTQKAIAAVKAATEKALSAWNSLAAIAAEQGVTLPDRATIEEGSRMMIENLNALAAINPSRHEKQNDRLRAAVRPLVAFWREHGPGATPEKPLKFTSNQNWVPGANGELEPQVNSNRFIFEVLYEYLVRGSEEYTRDELRQELSTVLRDFTDAARATEGLPPVSY